MNSNWFILRIINCAGVSTLEEKARLSIFYIKKLPRRQPTLIDFAFKLQSGEKYDTSVASLELKIDGCNLCPNTVIQHNLHKIAQNWRVQLAFLKNRRVHLHPSHPSKDATEYPLHFFGTKFSSLHADVLQQRIIFTAYHSSMTREFSSEKAR